MIGVDETAMLKATPNAPTRFASTVVAIERPAVLDLFEGRHGSQLDGWLTGQPEPWKAGIEVTVCDLHEPFRKALRKHVPDAITVADPFHVVGVATRALDKVRRRVQNETLSHRGRKADPLYRARKLLTKAAERLDDAGNAKLRGLLAAGDPDMAAAWLDGVIDDCAQARPAGAAFDGPHPQAMARPDPQLAHHRRLQRTHRSPEPAIKKIKRLGHGFRNFNSYRLRVLLYTGGYNWNLLGH